MRALFLCHTRVKKSFFGRVPKRRDVTTRSLGILPRRDESPKTRTCVSFSLAGIPGSDNVIEASKPAHQGFQQACAAELKFPALKKR